MKLRKTISWLMGTLQRSLFPKLEQCWDIVLTEKEKQLVSILELARVERFVHKSSDKQSESTFSRAFAEFADSGLGDKVHESMKNPKVELTNGIGAPKNKRNVHLTYEIPIMDRTDH